MSSDLRKCIHILHLVSKIKSSKLRNKILEDITHDDSVFYALSEIAHNIVHEKIKVPEKDRKKLKRYGNKLKCLAKPSKTLMKKKNRKVIVKQVGGVWPIVVPIVASLIGEIISKNNSKRNVIEKFENIIHIILKLSLIQGFNENGEIRNKFGSYLNGTSLHSLIKECLSENKVLNGENEFISLLVESNVNPDLIINEKIRQKMLSIKNSLKNDAETIAKVTKKVEDLTKTSKRKYDEIEDENHEKDEDINIEDNVPSKKIKQEVQEKINWETPNWNYDAKKLFREARNIAPAITFHDVNQWLSTQPTYTLHKTARKRFERNKIIVSGIDEQWQADLADVSSFSSLNKGFKYLLCVIDVFSKFAWVIPIKNKKPVSIVNAFIKIFRKRKPLYLQTDKGKEF
ncbi:hypothetical protein B4U79_05222, partial [Dinothrombium tinctorium]